MPSYGLIPVVAITALSLLGTRVTGKLTSINTALVGSGSIAGHSEAARQGRLLAYPRCYPFGRGAHT